MRKKCTFKIRFFLRSDQQNKNGESSIHVRITINSQRTSFSTNIFVHSDIWNTQIQRVANSKKKRVNPDILTRINRNLDNWKLKIQKLYDKLLDEQGYVLPENIKEAIFKKENPPKTVLYYCDQYLKKKKKG